MGWRIVVRGVVITCRIDVVKADHGEVSRYFQAGFTQSNDAECDHIVESENGREGVTASAQERFQRFQSFRRRGWDLNKLEQRLSRNLYTHLFRKFQNTLPAQHRVRNCFRPANKSNVSVPLLVKVFEGQVSTALIIRHQRRSKLQSFKFSPNHHYRDLWMCKACNTDGSACSEFATRIRPSTRR
jgi:hypothetical protein